MSESIEPLLQIRDVCVDYVTNNGNARAVNQVSLDIYPGETVGLAVNRDVVRVHWHLQSPIYIVRQR